jgi:hypothetical protein
MAGNFLTTEQLLNSQILLCGVIFFWTEFHLQMISSYEYPHSFSIAWVWLTSSEPVRGHIVQILIISILHLHKCTDLVIIYDSYASICIDGSEDTVQVRTIDFFSLWRVTCILYYWNYFMPIKVIKQHFS